ncbi:hypothetical protein C7S13_5415 [Burkholderia cepacia]|nr:hypothetical protein [Burkholderia cepacia]
MCALRREGGQAGGNGGPRESSAGVFVHLVGMQRSFLSFYRRGGRRIERPLLEIARRSIKALHRKGPLRNRGESRRTKAGRGRFGGKTVAGFAMGSKAQGEVR